MNQVLRRDKLAKLPIPEEKERSLLTLEDEEGDLTESLLIMRPEKEKESLGRMRSMRRRTRRSLCSPRGLRMTRMARDDEDLKESRLTMRPENEEGGVPDCQGG